MLLTTKKEYPMREYTPERLRHLTLLAEKYPTALSAYSEIIPYLLSAGEAAGIEGASKRPRRLVSAGAAAAD